MISKKVCMGLSKIAITTIIAIIATSLGGVVYAKDGDIYNISTTPITDEGGIGNILLNNRSTLFNMITNMGNYGYEVGSKLYKAPDVNDIFITNPTATIDTIYSDIKTNLTPISASAQTTLTVSFASAITIPATAVGVVPTLPSTVNVTLSDGTTASAAITWNAAATTAATYANVGQVAINGILAGYGNYAVSAIVTVSNQAIYKTQLNNEISEAQNMADIVSVGNSVGDCSQAAMDALNEAISVAQAVAESTNVTQNDIDNEVIILQLAQLSFNKTIITVLVPSTNSVSANTNFDQTIQVKIQGLGNFTQNLNTNSITLGGDFTGLTVESATIVDATHDYEANIRLVGNLQRSTGIGTITVNGAGWNQGYNLTCSIAIN